MNDDFASRTGDALLGFPSEDEPTAVNTPEAVQERAVTPDPLLDDVPPPNGLWSKIERQLRREGVIR